MLQYTPEIRRTPRPLVLNSSWKTPMMLYYIKSLLEEKFCTGFSRTCAPKFKMISLSVLRSPFSGHLNSKFSTIEGFWVQFLQKSKLELKLNMTVVRENPVLPLGTNPFAQGSLEPVLLNLKWFLCPFSVLRSLVILTRNFRRSKGSGFNSSKSRN